MAQHAYGVSASLTPADRRKLGRTDTTRPKVALVAQRLSTVMFRLGRSGQALEHHFKQRRRIDVVNPAVNGAICAAANADEADGAHHQQRSFSVDATNCPVRPVLALTLCWLTHSRLARSLSDIATPR